MVVYPYVKTGLFILVCLLHFPSLAQESRPAYILKSIYFGGGSYQVDPDQWVDVVKLVDSLENITDYSITIHSHTDNIGGAAYNEWLSKMRGEAVIRELLRLDFDESQIERKDFGQFNPVYDNHTWEGRAKNRRVDIIFWPVVM